MMGFNSRTRVGATADSPHAPFQTRVSIHAPVWVRQNPSDGPAAQRRFQFTHPCGCDQFPHPAFSNSRGFNSRTRVGATADSPHAPFQTRVSIHAPVWVRHKWLPRVATGWQFQFTHPCGCDNRRRNRGGFRCGFNSRTRVGATKLSSSKGGKLPVSIHAPVWVRRALLTTSRVCTRFQFTHPCGCDSCPGGA